MKTHPFLLVSSVAAITAIHAQSTTPTDPRITSWYVTPSARHARLYENDAAKNAGNSVTTWSRGAGVQSTPSYAGVMQVSYSSNWVYLRSSGLGYHVMGPWYLNAGHTQLFPNFPANSNVLYRIPRAPSVPTTKTLTGAGAIGYFVDGVALFDNRDTFSYVNASSADGSPMGGARGDGIWNRDAYVNEGVTFDAAFAHQAGSNYHYHANTPALRHLLGDRVDYDATTRSYRESTTPAARHSPILAWAADGYPLYGPYGYALPMDPASGVRRMISGYVKRDGTNNTTDLAATGRTTLPAWAARAQNRNVTLAASQSGPAVSAAFVLGRYLEDYDHLGELSFTQGTHFDLDLYNGRFCVTPEFPEGTYAYFMSIESDGTPKFPYNLGRWFYGSPVGGSVSGINEAVTEHIRGGQAMAISVTATATDSGVVVRWSSVEGGTYSLETSADGATFSTIATAITSDGIATTYTTTTKANYYRVTLSAVAAYDPRGTGGVSGVNGSGMFRYPTETAVVGSSGTARLVNIATRVQVGGATGTPVSGFVLQGSGARAMLVRAVGPTLTSFGMTGVLPDPAVSLVANGATIASNDNWSVTDNPAMVASGAFALTAGSRDAAIFASLGTGAYSAPLNANDGSGVTLLEVYDASASSSSGPMLVNASTRAFVGTGEQVLIPAFVVSGTGSMRLLVRAVGPTLANFGVTGTLADPQITLYRGDVLVASNDNWSTATNATEIQNAATQAGAFALAGGSRDAAVLATLGEGAYSAVVSGVGGATGTALVEIYAVQ